MRRIRKAFSYNDKLLQFRFNFPEGHGKSKSLRIGKITLTAMLGNYSLTCSDPEEWNRYEAVNIVSRLRFTTMLPELVSLLEGAPDIVKAGILDVLGELGSSEHREIIETYAKSENPLLKDAAMEALGMKNEECLSYFNIPYSSNYQEISCHSESFTKPALERSEGFEDKLREESLVIEE